MSQTTREERRSALDDFAAQTKQEAATVPAVAFAQPLDLVHGAQAVAVHRDEQKVLARLRALAAGAGTDWFYRFPVKNKKTGTTDFIEGPSIKLANDLMRIYGNAEVDCRATDLGDAWLFHARFIDLETGYSLTRPFQQRKSASRIGGADDERRLDIAFQIGASKAIRNVVVNALQTFADYAFDEARNALVDRIGADLEGWRQRTLDRLAERHVELGRVEAVIGRPAREWLAPDIARIVAMMRAVSDGMASLDETFPPIHATEKPQPENARSALDAFAASVVLGEKEAREKESRGGTSTAAAASPQDADPPAPDGDGGGSGPPSAAADPERGATIDLFLKIAADKSFTPQERLRDIDDLASDYGQVPGIEQIVRTAIDVVENRVKPAEARKHLEGLP